jgi:HAE1 family hydrophobic/amphiphilic exporter-1
VTVAVLLVVIFGMLGLFRVPIQLTPNVDQPVVNVATNWFGASPQEIEQEIIQEQEEVLKTVSGLRDMRSTAVEGRGTIDLEFQVGVDKQAALNEVRDKLRQVPAYPTDVDEPVVESVDSNQDNYIAWMLIRPAGGKRENLRAGNGWSGDVTHLQTWLEDNVKPVLERVPGVAEVNVIGGREREMQVHVDLEKLAARGISITQFTEALRRENLSVSAGAVPEGKRETSVRAVGQYDDPEQILSTVVGWTAADAPVYVRDVAMASVGYKRQIAEVRSEGEAIIALNAKRQTGSNILTVMEGLKEAIRDVNQRILPATGWGLDLHQVYDESVYVKQSIDNAAKDLLVGAALAMIVLFITLRSVGATLVVAVSIPISVIGTFLGMYLTGRNLNVISMAGLAFAIGMGVDNTIVVLENIFRHREMGKDRFHAAVDGTREVWGAIVAATLANIAVFLPVVFIQEEAGQLFRDISIAISISLFFYMVVSPTVIPMLATLFLQRMPGGFSESRSGEIQQTRPTTVLGRLTNPIGHLGVWMSHEFHLVILWLTRGWIRRIVLVVVMVGLAVIGSYGLMPPRDYLPQGNQNFVFSILSPPPGYSLAEFRKMAEQVEAQLRPWWEVGPEDGDDDAARQAKQKRLAELQQQWRQLVNTQVIPRLEQTIQGLQKTLTPEMFAQVSGPLQGQLAGLRYGKEPPAIDSYFFVAVSGRAFMGASSADYENVPPLVTLMNGAVQGIPGVFGMAGQVPIFRLGRGIGRTIEVNVAGSDYEQVRTAAGAVQGMLMQSFNSFPTSDPLNFAVGRPEMQVIADRPRAAAAGVSVPTIRQIAQVAVDGIILGDYRDHGDVIDLTVLADARPSTAELADLPLASALGTVVPLSAVARLVPTSAAQQINRLERQPSITLSVQLPAAMTVDESRTIVETRIVAPLKQSGVIPPGVQVELTGSADKLREFQKAFVPDTSSFAALLRDFVNPPSGLPGGVFVIAAVITYLLLAALFESWLHPFVIIMSVPFALVGGFMGLWLLHVSTGARMDVLTMLGFVILIGTIVNNPILIVHQALNYIRDEGMDRQHAIALSTQTRVRPIFMSVITSVAGMAPLVVWGGQGSELYRGLGAVVIGGLLVSTVFTLFLTPTLMSLMMDAQEVLRRAMHREPKPATATAA